MLIAVVVLTLCSAPGPHDVQAHEDRQTLVAAEKAKAFGIETYRVTQRGNGLRPSPTDPKQPTTTHLFAELLDASGAVVGKWRTTVRWRKERDEAVKANKYFELEKQYVLTWQGATLESTMSADGVAVSYNGTVIYAGSFERSPALEAFMLATPAPFQLAGAIEADLTKASRPAAPEIQCCVNGTIVCSGTASWGSGTGVQRFVACENAWQAASNGCWNQYCIGCCSFSDCSTWCLGEIVGAEAFCFARVRGTNCRCVQFAI